MKGDASIKDKGDFIIADKKPTDLLSMRARTSLYIHGFNSPKLPLIEMLATTFWKSLKIAAAMEIGKKADRLNQVSRAV